MKMIFLFLFTIAPSLTLAALTPGARVFTGETRIGLAARSPCYVELLYSGDLASVTTRSITPLPHTATNGETSWVALGPYTASFVPSRSLYRYQDATPAALVKDLVVMTPGGSLPTKYAVLFWHAEASHHDPISCERLTEATSPQDLQTISDAFANFEQLKP